MKSIIRNTLIYSVTLFFLPQLIPGVHIHGGIPTFLIGGFALALMFLILKPILNIISFPVNILTLGLFSIFTNALILYLLTVFISAISIDAFVFHKTSVFGIILPRTEINTLGAYLLSSVVLSAIDGVIKWMIE